MGQRSGSASRTCLVAAESCTATGGGPALRPKANGDLAHFYTLVTRDTRELDFAHHRQLFLTEQGYSYAIMDGGDFVSPVRKTG